MMGTALRHHDGHIRLFALCLQPLGRQLWHQCVNLESQHQIKGSYTTRCMGAQDHLHHRLYSGQLVINVLIAEDSWLTSTSLYLVMCRSGWWLFCRCTQGTGLLYDGYSRRGSDTRLSMRKQHTCSATCPMSLTYLKAAPAGNFDTTAMSDRAPWYATQVLLWGVTS